jgi:predicted  nucleic acid-binding Zn-ribbon protein
MNKSLRLLLELEELVMLREGVECTSAPGEEPGVENLLEKIEKIRRRVPGSLLSEYDKLARVYLDTVSIVSGGMCQACEGRVSGRLYHLVEQSSQVVQCEHCGRFLMTPEAAPDYVAVS